MVGFNGYKLYNIKRQFHLQFACWKPGQGHQWNTKWLIRNYYLLHLYGHRTHPFDYSSPYSYLLYLYAWQLSSLLGHQEKTQLDIYVLLKAMALDTAYNFSHGSYGVNDRGYIYFNLALIINPMFSNGYSETRCSAAMLFDDILNGNYTQDGSSYWIGLKPLKKTFPNLTTSNSEPT